MDRPHRVIRKKIRDSLMDSIEGHRLLDGFSNGLSKIVLDEVWWGLDRGSHCSVMDGAERAALESFRRGTAV